MYTVASRQDDVKLTHAREMYVRESEPGNGAQARTAAVVLPSGVPFSLVVLISLLLFLFSCAPQPRLFFCLQRTSGVLRKVGVCLFCPESSFFYAIVFLLFFHFYFIHFLVPPVKKKMVFFCLCSRRRRKCPARGRKWNEIVMMPGWRSGKEDVLLSTMPSLCLPFPPAASKNLSKTKIAKKGHQSK